MNQNQVLSKAWKIALIPINDGRRGVLAWRQGLGYNFCKWI
jgi:hypothetical protein